MRKFSCFTLTAALALSALALSARADTAPAASVASADLPEVNHMVYLSFLPEPDELMKDAATNGLTVLRLDKTADKVVVSYRYPDGHTATLGYALLSAASKADRVARSDSEIRALRMERVDPKPYTVVTSEPEVVYVERPYSTRVVYRDAYWDDFWVPLTLGVGLGWATSWHGGHGYHGGYHGGWHGGHGGRH